MRRILLTALLMTVFLPHITGKDGQKKPIGNAIGINLTDLTDENRISLAFCHMISERWSAGFETSLRLDSAEAGKDLVLNCISAQYWPLSPLEGPMIGIGISSSLKSGEDWFSELAYRFRVFDNLMLGIGYRISLLKKNRVESLGTEGLRLTLEYGF